MSIHDEMSVYKHTYTEPVKDDLLTKEEKHAIIKEDTRNNYLRNKQGKRSDPNKIQFLKILDRVTSSTYKEPIRIVKYLADDIRNNKPDSYIKREIKEKKTKITSVEDLLRLDNNKIETELGINTDDVTVLKKFMKEKLDIINERSILQDVGDNLNVDDDDEDDEDEDDKPKEKQKKTLSSEAKKALNDVLKELRDESENNDIKYEKLLKQKISNDHAEMDKGNFEDYIYEGEDKIQIEAFRTLSTVYVYTHKDNKEVFIRGRRLLTKEEKKKLAEEIEKRDEQIRKDIEIGKKRKLEYENAKREEEKKKEEKKKKEEEEEKKKKKSFLGRLGFRSGGKKTSHKRKTKKHNKRKTKKQKTKRRKRTTIRKKK